MVHLGGFVSPLAVVVVEVRVSRVMIFPLVFMSENGGAGELSGGSVWDAAEAGCGDWIAVVVVMIAAAAAVVVAVAVLRWKKVRLPIGLL